MAAQSEPLKRKSVTDQVLAEIDKDRAEIDRTQYGQIVIDIHNGKPTNVKITKGRRVP